MEIYSKNCLQCNEIMYRYKKSEAERPNWNFCSKSCRTIYDNIKRTKGIDGYKNCKNCDKQFSFRKSLKVRGIKSKIHGNVGAINQEFCSFDCSINWRNKFNNPMKIDSIKEKISGSNNYNWKGGITPINTQIRKSTEYKLWRTLVFERDSWTCVWCKQVGCKIEADHIKPFSQFPELRFDIDNGRTLCVTCHKMTDTYAGKLNKK